MTVLPSLVGTQKIASSSLWSNVKPESQVNPLEALSKGGTRAALDIADVYAATTAARFPGQTVSTDALGMLAVS
ncbi:MAG: hypothetical protein HYU64_05105 [Armatimonadetes bacterium]|nr:hypothetical protein [Armatimonadota bacterium]